MILLDTEDHIFLGHNYADLTHNSSHTSRSRTTTTSLPWPPLA